MTDKPDWSDKLFPIFFDSPLTVHVDRETGAIWFQSSTPHRAVSGGVTMRALLSPGATRELVLAVKEIETILDTPIEHLAKPDSVQ